MLSAWMKLGGFNMKQVILYIKILSFSAVQCSFQAKTTLENTVKFVFEEIFLQNKGIFGGFKCKKPTLLQIYLNDISINSIH